MRHCDFLAICAISHLKSRTESAKPMGPPVCGAYCLPYHAVSLSMSVASYCHRFHLHLVHIYVPKLSIFHILHLYLYSVIRCWLLSLCSLGAPFAGVPRVSLGSPLQGMHPSAVFIYLIYLGSPLQESEVVAGDREVALPSAHLIAS